MREVPDVKNWTRDQIDRLKQAMIYLALNDDEIQFALRRCVRTAIPVSDLPPLTKEKLVERIYHKVRPLKHGEHFNAYPITEIYDALIEYPRPMVRQLLFEFNVAVKEPDPETGKLRLKEVKKKSLKLTQVRCWILNA